MVVHYRPFMTGCECCTYATRCMIEPKDYDIEDDITNDENEVNCKDCIENR